jgi:hypothetical protein
MLLASVLLTMADVVFKRCMVCGTSGSAIIIVVESNGTSPGVREPTFKVQPRVQLGLLQGGAGAASLPLSVVLRIWPVHVISTAYDTNRLTFPVMSANSACLDIGWCT